MEISKQNYTKSTRNYFKINHMQLTKICNVVLKKESFSLHWGVYWCWIVKSLHNHPYCWWGCFFLSEGVAPLLWITNYNASLSGYIDPNLTMWLGKVGALLKVFLHASYNAIVNGKCGVILYLMPHMVDHFWQWLTWCHHCTHLLRALRT